MPRSIAAGTDSDAADADARDSDPLDAAAEDADERAVDRSARRSREGRAPDRSPLPVAGSYGCQSVRFTPFTSSQIPIAKVDSKPGHLRLVADCETDVVHREINDLSDATAARQRRRESSARPCQA